ncbi:uncharacterized protein PFL1_02918 [Pseudozyma flocculosa PF-1]|uniref:TPR-like protein n=2 Tax=Pseudozyma flocculosa TaxID=84751 RepID=A0A5C3F179_9BASI|nr:uncharacterized protein PFL1_02918 [Pseudozyma flocculosa PF-1]EPQ29698.1 hypothetical protein PFL1_02918 [Pseudozyma flocculosa PF-1]SPO38274.1 uncharacterized protein PSFLO_03751 [Pseudozyma flocculosa]
MSAQSSPSHSAPAAAATITEIDDPIQEAHSLKAAANAHFQAARYDDAVAGYLDALAVLPPRPTPPPSFHDEEQPHDHDGEQELCSNDQQDDDDDDDNGQPPAPRPADEPQEIKTLRATINANLSLCYLKLHQHAQAVDAATQALISQPLYVKALHRRSLANIQIDTLASLSSALEDQKLLLTLPDLPASTRPSIQKSIADLEPRVGELAEKEKQEMLTKLKGIGNSLLGTFGLSTDNFQFVKQDNGGYSMNFVR